MISHQKKYRIQINAQTIRYHFNNTQEIDTNLNNQKIRQIMRKSNNSCIYFSLAYLTVLFKLFSLSYSECFYPFQRCICSTPVATPYCPCQFITSLQTLNFSSTYFSHLTLLSNYGCKPCDSGCQRCTNTTLCTQCLDQFELISNKCVPCPINCRTCKNGVCSVCNSLYYIDYQNTCQMCPLQGTNTCTIDSLTSCLPNYWLDNNGANCINCDSNCQTCSSTTKCSICNDGFYQNNFKCFKCKPQCQICSNSTTCTTCINNRQYFNSTNSLCQACIGNCLQCSNGFQCNICHTNFYLTKQKLCSSLQKSNEIQYCQFYYQNSSNSSQILCNECHQGYYMLNSVNHTSCYMSCSILCRTCSGAHYGACQSCADDSVLMNKNCLPKYNINAGTAFQRYYNALNNIDIFFNTNLLNPNSCWHEHLANSKTTNIKISLDNLRSYKLKIQFKLYSFNNSSNIPFYNVLFYNQEQYKNSTVYFNTSKECSSNRLQCNTSLVCLHKYTLTFQVVRSSNNLSFQSSSNISLSEILVTGYRCGGVYGDGCQQCSDINTCIKCLDSSFFIIGERCIIECPQNYYTYFAKGICYQLCPQGTYSQDSLHQCLDCISPCNTCSSAQKCITCQDNTYLNSLTKQCLLQCPIRHYADQYRKSCQKCVFPCLQCLNNYMCLQCVYGFYSNSSYKCVLQCQTSLYGNFQSRKCQKCQNPCYQCEGLGSYCKSCVNGYYLHQNQCLLKCPISHFQHDGQTISSCQKCFQACLTCQQQLTNCTSCNFGYFLFVQNSTCLQACPLSFYKNYLTLNCTKCPAQCQRCSSHAICSGCLAPYLYDQSTYSCASQCPQYYYNASGTCYRCQLPCYDCMSLSQCSSCYDAFLFNLTCVTQCPSGYFADVQKLQCSKCDKQKCLECEVTNSTCTLCSQGLLLIQGQCLAECWAQFYYSNYKSECILCQGLCETCSNQTYCLSCISDFILINNTGICVSKCSEGFYKIPMSQLSINQSICQSCNESCLSCEFDSNFLKQICISCKLGFYLLNGSCYSNCPMQYYEYAQTSECYICSAPCKSCEDQNICQSCLQNFGYYFLGECLQSCPYQYFQAERNDLFVCQLCDMNCQFCQKQAKNCTSCEKGLYLAFSISHSGNQISGKCQVSCQKGFFSLPYDNICFPCSQNCLSCTIFSQCTSCDSSKSQSILYKNSCVAQCPPLYYMQIIINQKQCQACPDMCSICLNNSFCLQCQNQYFLNQNNDCVDICPPKTFAQNFICRNCNFPCQTCSSSQICASCLMGVYYQGKCIQNCPIGTFLVNSSACENCSLNCSICTTFTNCLFCQKGALFAGECLQDCLKGYYQFYGACIQCSYGCSSCLNNHQCIQCANGFLYEGNCVQYCPNGWVNIQSNISVTYNQTNSPAYYKCVKCINGCQKCVISSDKCFDCSPGLLLYINQCLSSCPFGSYPDYPLKICQVCVSPCQTCTNSYSCQTCVYGYILYRQDQRNQCVQGPICPNSYYLNQDTNICEYVCQAKLFVNQKTRTCSLSCGKGYVSYPSNMSCLQFCPQKMWLDENYYCQSDNTMPLAIELPVISCQPLIIRNNLLIFCKSNVQLINMKNLKKDSFSLSQSQIQQIRIGSSSDFCLVTSQSQHKIISTELRLTFLYPYTLLSLNKSKATAQTATKKDQIFQSSLTSAKSYVNYPVQNYYTDIFIQEFYYFTSDQRSIGMNFYEIGQSLGIGALIIWLFSMIKNLKSTNLLYLLNMQWLFSVSILSNNLAPNLNQFLQGLKLTNLFFIYASNQGDQTSLWNFQDSNEQAFGVNNLYNLNETLAPVYGLVALFIIIFIISWSLLKILDRKDQNQQVSNIAGKAKIIYERFFYNYTFQIFLYCANPITLCAYLSCFNATISSFITAIFLILAYIGALILCICKYIAGQRKSHRASKYFFVQIVQAMTFNFFIVINNFSFYMGLIIVMFTLKLFIWHHIFRKKEPARCLNLQIIQVLKIILAVVFIVGQMKKQNWDSASLYNYGFVQVIACLIVIIFSSLYVSRQLFASQQNKQSRQSMRKGSLKSKTVQGIKEQSEPPGNKQQNSQQQEIEQSFFTNITPVDSDSSQGDIIDFDSNQGNKQKRPAQLYRYDNNYQQA